MPGLFPVIPLQPLNLLLATILTVYPFDNKYIYFYKYIYNKNVVDRFDTPKISQIKKFKDVPYLYLDVKLTLNRFFGRII